MGLGCSTNFLKWRSFVGGGVTIKTNHFAVIFEAFLSLLGTYLFLIQLYLNPDLEILIIDLKN